MERQRKRDRNKGRKEEGREGRKGLQEEERKEEKGRTHISRGTEMTVPTGLVMTLTDHHSHGFVPETLVSSTV